MFGSSELDDGQSIRSGESREIVSVIIYLQLFNDFRRSKFEFFSFFDVFGFFKSFILNSTFKVSLGHFFSDILFFTITLKMRVSYVPLKKMTVLPVYHNMNSCKIYHTVLRIGTLEGAISKKVKIPENIFCQI